MSSTPRSTPKKSPKRSVRSSRRLQGSEMPSWKVLLAQSNSKKSNKREEEESDDEQSSEEEVMNDQVSHQSYEEEEEEEEEEDDEVSAAWDDDDDDAPEAVSLSTGKQMALDLKKKELESQKAYKQEQKERARKLFHSDNVKEVKEKKNLSLIDTSLFDEIEEDESNKKAEEKARREEKQEKRKRKREMEEAKAQAQKPKKKKFSSVEVVLSSDVGGRSINSRARSRLNRHYRRPDRNVNSLSSSRAHAPSSSFA